MLQKAPQPASSAVNGSSGGCRFCGTPLQHTFVDLGMSPLCESWLSADELNRMEPFYPLHAFVCERCFLVQVKAYVRGENIFTSEYAYFSSYSRSWLEHAARYVEMITARLGLHAGSQVVEVASNDGYLLKNFAQRGIPALGIEPAAGCAAAAERVGVTTRVMFFGHETARALREEGIRADLLLGNNVLAHVPDLNDFVAGIHVLLADDGVSTWEFPHLLRLIESVQFDTIYQEHYCYFSLLFVEQLFQAHGLVVFDVEQLPTHGGSLRIYVRHAERGREVSPAVEQLRELERAAGLDTLRPYAEFTERVRDVKHALLEFLIRARREGKRVAGYGAPGKAATLLNYCGIREDLLEYTVDRSPHKQGRYMPGVHIPVFAPEKLEATRPDYILILPWNLKDEIAEQLAYARQWGAKLVVPIPRVEVLS